MPDTMPPRRRSRPRPVRVAKLRAYVVRGPHPDDRWYWRIGYHEGHRLIPVQTGWWLRTEVEHELARLVAAGGWHASPSTDLKVETVEHLILVYLAARRRDRDEGLLAPASYAAYLHAGRQCSPLIGDVRLDRLVAQHLERARGTLLQRLAPRTVAQIFRVLRMAWRWGMARGHTPPRPLPRVSVRVGDQHVYCHYTPSMEEAAAVIDHLEGWRRVGAELLWATGARVGEIGNLTWAQVDLEKLELELRGKTGRRLVPIDAELAALLRRPDTAAEDNTVLGVQAGTARVGLRQALVDACRDLDQPVFTPHGLRRLASSMLIATGTDPRTYEAMMGHSYMMGLRMYAEVSSAHLRSGAAVLGRRGLREGQVIAGPWAHQGKS